jgi:RNA polymerase sigma-70 factor (ECF subfamily)
MTGPEPAPDLQVLAATPDDARSRAQLASAVHEIVRRYCRARIGRSGRGFGTADELAEELATDIVREHGDEFGGPVPVAAIVHAHMAPAVTRALAGRRVPPRAPGRGPVSPEQVQEQLAGLPARSREVLVLRAFVGLTSEQVGLALGLSPDVVRHEQQLAMTHLRRP